MANDYFNHDNPLARQTLARAEQVNAIFQAVQDGFDKLPDPTDVDQGRVTYFEDTGTANAYVVTFDSAPAAYVEGLLLTMKAANANTGASMLNVNGLGVKPIRRYTGDPLEPGDILAGMLVHLGYDGTNFRIIGAHGAESALAKDWAIKTDGIVAGQDYSAKAHAVSEGLIAAGSAKEWSTKTSAVSGGLKGARGYAQDASASASNAATSAQNAQSQLESFRGIYYGALASDPSQDPNGDPPTVGDWYFNTSINATRMFDGENWGNLGTAILAHFKFTAAGGETSLSGEDDNGDILTYTVSLIQVYKNGVRLVEGGDFTADDGSSITGLAALDPGDIITIDAFSRIAIDNLTPVFYGTKAALEAATPPPVSTLLLQGYHSPGDGGGALYKRSASEPSHPGKIQSADGAWWELTAKTIFPEMQGALGDGSNDDADAIDAVFAIMLAYEGRRELEYGPTTYRVTREVGAVDAGCALAVRGAGATQTFLYGDFVGAGDYILNMSATEANDRSARGHRVSGIGFLGNSVAGDPQGLGLVNAFESIVDNIDAPAAPNANSPNVIAGTTLHNSLIVVTRDNNSKYNNIRSQSGWQPLKYDQQDATVSFTSGDATITATAAVFTDAMVGETIYIADGSTSGRNQQWKATIASINGSSPSTSCEIDITAPNTESGISFAVGVVTGSISSGSNSLTLDAAHGISSDIVGMQVHVAFASTKTDTSGNQAGLLSTRVTAVSGLTLTLEDNATNTVSSEVVLFAPKVFVGSFQGEAAGRQTNHSWWGNVHLEGGMCCQVIANKVYYLEMAPLKIHGTGQGNPKWEHLVTNAVLSEVKGARLGGLQQAWGVLPQKLWVMGSRGVLYLDESEFAQAYVDESVVRVDNVDEDFRLIPNGMWINTGTEGFSDDYSLISVDEEYSVEYGFIASRNNKLRTLAKNSAIHAPGATAQYQRIVIADDEVFVFRPPGNFGTLHFNTSAGGNYAIVSYRTSEASSGTLMQEVVVSNNINTTTGNLTDGTSNGLDGAVTISVGSSDGNIYIKNRRGITLFCSLFITPFGDG